MSRRDTQKPDHQLSRIGSIIGAILSLLAFLTWWYPAISAQFATWAMGLGVTHCPDGLLCLLILGRAPLYAAAYNFVPAMLLLLIMAALWSYRRWVLIAEFPLFKKATRLAPSDVGFRRVARATGRETAGPVRPYFSRCRFQHWFVDHSRSDELEDAEDALTLHVSKETGSQEAFGAPENVDERTATARGSTLHDLVELLKQQTSIALVARYGAGKTHAAFTILRKLRGRIVLMLDPRREPPSHEAFGLCKGKHVILFIDGLEDFAGDSYDSDNTLLEQVVNSIEANGAMSLTLLCTMIPQRAERVRDPNKPSYLARRIDRWFQLTDVSRRRLVEGSSCPDTVGNDGNVDGPAATSGTPAELLGVRCEANTLRRLRETDEDCQRVLAAIVLLKQHGVATSRERILSVLNHAFGMDITWARVIDAARQLRGRPFLRPIGSATNDRQEPFELTAELVDDLVHEVLTTGFGRNNPLGLLDEFLNSHDWSVQRQMLINALWKIDDAGGLTAVARRLAITGYERKNEEFDWAVPRVLLERILDTWRYAWPLPRRRTHAVALVTLGLTLMKQSSCNYDDAIATWRKAISLFEEEKDEDIRIQVVLAWENIYILHFNRGNYEQSRQAAAALIERIDFARAKESMLVKRAAADHWRFQSYSREKNYPEARRLALAFIETYGSTPATQDQIRHFLLSAHDLVAWTYENEKRFAEARAERLRLIARIEGRSDDETAKKIVEEYLQIAATHTAEKDHAAARKVCQKVVGDFGSRLAEHVVIATARVRIIESYELEGAIDKSRNQIDQIITTTEHARDLYSLTNRNGHTTLGDNKWNRNGLRRALEQAAGTDNGPAPLQMETLRWTTVHWSVGARRLDLAERLLDEDGTLVDRRVGDGQTAAHIAAMMSNVEMLRLLKKRNADLGVTDDYGYTPFALALVVKAKESAAYLTAEGKNEFNTDRFRFRFSDNNWSAAHYFAATGDDKALGLALEMNPALLHARAEAMLPVHVAARAEQYGIVKALLKVDKAAGSPDPSDRELMARIIEQNQPGKTDRVYERFPLIRQYVAGEPQITGDMSATVKPLVTGESPVPEAEEISSPIAKSLLNILKETLGLDWAEESIDDYRNSRLLTDSGSGAGKLASDALALFSARLPWYRKIKLWCLRSTDYRPGDVEWFALWNSDSCDDPLVLNGQSDPIHNANTAGPIRLNSENVLSYLRFFCQFILGAEGPFMVIDEKQGATLMPDAWSIRSLVRYHSLVPRSFEVGQGMWSCDAFINYSNALFESHLIVHSTGHVEMLSDLPILTGLPRTVTYRVGHPLQSPS